MFSHTEEACFEDENENRIYFGCICTDKMEEKEEENTLMHPTYAHYVM